MVKVRMTVAATDTDGKAYGPGQEADVSEEQAHDWRSDGKASYVEDEEKQAKAAQEGGVYNARTSRADTGEAVSTEAPQQKPAAEPPPKDKK